jgi:serine/threonine-protein kinase
MAVLQPGVRLKGGTYEIVSLLGQGGFGEVYLARQARVDRDVAIKVLLPHVSANQSMVMRFQGEALAAGSLDHPNVLTVFDFDFEEALGVWFLALQYIPGGRTLRSVLGAPLPLGDAIHYIEAIAGALDAAHSRGITHRDVKPENVLLQVDDRSGVVRPLLTDFGLARLRTSGVHTATGLIMGTLAYMSPEQGRGKDIGPASDQYALGIMAYEMLGGRRPFAGDQISLLLAHANETPPSLTALNPLVNAATRAAVLLALSKAPEERFATCTEFAQALRSASGWETAPPIGTPPPSTPPPLAAALDLTAQRPPRGRGDAGSMVPSSGKEPITAEESPRAPSPVNVSPPTLVDAVEPIRVGSASGTPQPQSTPGTAKPADAIEVPAPIAASSGAPAPPAEAEAASPTPIAPAGTKPAEATSQVDQAAPPAAVRSRAGLIARLATAALAVFLLAAVVPGVREPVTAAVARVVAPPSPTASSAAGLFALESNPTADVLLDGTVVGRTPLELRLAAGTSHEITLRAATYREQVWPVQVEGGVRRPIVVALEPLSAAELLVPYTAPDLAPRVGHTLFKDFEGINRLEVATDRFLRSDGVGAIVYLENRAFGVRELTYTAVARWHVAANEAEGRPWREEVQQHKVPPTSKVWDQAFCLPGFLLDAAGSGVPLRLEFLIDGHVAAQLPFRVEGGDPGGFVRSKCEIGSRQRTT